MDNLEMAQALEEAATMTVDFSAASDDFENLPEGRYTVEVVKAGPGKSKAGNPVLKLAYKVIAGEDAGRWAFSSTNITGKSAWKTRKCIRGLGVTVEGESLQLDPKDLIGRKAVISIEPDEDGQCWVNDWSPVTQSVGLE